LLEGVNGGCIDRWERLKISPNIDMATAVPPAAASNALLYPSGDTVVEGSVSKGDEKVHVVYHLPHQKMVYDGKRMRKAITRRTVDYNNDLMMWTQVRCLCSTSQHFSCSLAR
jgi:hypothetical protein